MPSHQRGTVQQPVGVASAAASREGTPLLRRTHPPLVLVVMLLLAAAAPAVVRAEGAPPACGDLLKEFYEFNKHEAVPYGGDNMIYFLHIPR